MKRLLPTGPGGRRRGGSRAARRPHARPPDARPRGGRGGRHPAHMHLLPSVRVEVGVGGFCTGNSPPCGGWAVGQFSLGQEATSGWWLFWLYTLLGVCGGPSTSGFGGPAGSVAVRVWPFGRGGPTFCWLSGRVLVCRCSVCAVLCCWIRLAAARRIHISLFSVFGMVGPMERRCRFSVSGLG